MRSAELSTDAGLISPARLVVRGRARDVVMLSAARGLKRTSSRGHVVASTGAGISATAAAEASHTPATAELTAAATAEVTAAAAAEVTTAATAEVTAAAAMSAAASSAAVSTTTCLSPSEQSAETDAHHEAAKQSGFPKCSFHDSSSEKGYDAMDLAATPRLCSVQPDSLGVVGHERAGTAREDDYGGMDGGRRYQSSSASKPIGPTQRDNPVCIEVRRICHQTGNVTGTPHGTPAPFEAEVSFTPA